MAHDFNSTTGTSDHRMTTPETQHQMVNLTTTSANGSFQILREPSRLHTVAFLQLPSSPYFPLGLVNDASFSFYGLGDSLYPADILPIVADMKILLTKPLSNSTLRRRWCARPRLIVIHPFHKLQVLTRDNGKLTIVRYQRRSLLSLQTYIVAVHAPSGSEINNMPSTVCPLAASSCR